MTFTNTRGTDAFPDAQHAAMALADAFTERDRARFLTLTADERDAQLLARHELASYVDALWEEAKAAGLNPALDSAWKGVAGMRDLLSGLSTTAAFLLHEGLDDE
ncbi:hypothetical protein [Embleya hyalina]|uniref:Uncharacterized protein n=1 Tax=Embleya hyalina TaxID=516124 RepID=A0A401Z3V4_9ACTN|nr:hypothetical protein [Embleya hyalina]GCE01531.1 hypothetical protein EHYA_09297 [Embleya hyalina]